MPQAPQILLADRKSATDEVGAIAEVRNELAVGRLIGRIRQNDHPAPGLDLNKAVISSPDGATVRDDRAACALARPSVRRQHRIRPHDGHQRATADAPNGDSATMHASTHPRVE